MLLILATKIDFKDVATVVLENLSLDIFMGKLFVVQYFHLLGIGQKF